MLEENQVNTEELYLQSLVEETVDIQLERGIIGAMLNNIMLARKAPDYLNADDFYKPEFAKMFTILVNYSAKYSEIDYTLILKILENHGLSSINGEYLEELLIEGTPIQSIFTELCDMLREKSIKRKLLIQFSTQSLAYKKPEQILQEMNDFITQTDIKRVVSKTAFDICKDYDNKKLEELIKSKAFISGLPSGFLQLDKKTTGFHGGELIIVGARPSMGKTAFALNVAVNMAKADKDNQILFFSLEMNFEQIAQRLLSMMTKIELYRIRVGLISDEERKAIQKKYEEEVADILKNIHIIEDAKDILQILLYSKRFANQFNIKAIFIDYLQMIRIEKQRNNRQEEVAYISMQLKALAKELNVPVIALAQLSRQTEHRSDKRPQLSDLRESGQIEQDADLVMFLHRPEYYKKSPLPEEKGLMEVLLSKHRQGELGIINLTFKPEISMLMERKEEPQQYEVYREDDDIDEIGNILS